MDFRDQVKVAIDNKMSVQMKTITPVKDYIYNHDGKIVFLPIKWNFILLSKVQGTFLSYEQYGPLSLIQSKCSIFITFESY